MQLAPPHRIFPLVLEQVGVVNAIARVLAQLTDKNDAATTPITRFTAARPPEIPVSDYVRRIAQYADASDTAFVLALIYLDRVQAKRPAVILSTLNFHRLFVSSILVAAKFIDDKYYNNAYYARIGGLARDELSRLEIELVFALEFDLTVDTDEFHRYTMQLAEHAKAELVVRAQTQAMIIAMERKRMQQHAPPGPYPDLSLAPFHQQLSHHGGDYMSEVQSSHASSHPSGMPDDDMDVDMLDMTNLDMNASFDAAGSGLGLHMTGGAQPGMYPQS